MPQSASCLPPAAGLAVGAHTTDPDTAAVAPYQPDGPPTGIAWPDLMPFLLGNFETVGEAVEFLDAQVWVVAHKGQAGATSGLKFERSCQAGALQYLAL